MMERLNEADDKFGDWLVEELNRQDKEPKPSLDEGKLLAKRFEFLDKYAAPATINDVAYLCFVIGKNMEEINPVIRARLSRNKVGSFAGFVVEMMLSGMAKKGRESKEESSADESKS